MSWKGFQKAVSRLPHQMLAKKSEVTNDTEFISLEKRFNELSKVLERLVKDAQGFRDAVASLVSHQAAMAAFLAVIYDTHLAIDQEGRIQRRVQQTPAAAMQAVADAEAAMSYCRDEVLAELDNLDVHIVRPTIELQEIMKIISKTIVKRNHKMIDYDRHRASMNKLKSKQERSFNEEKQIFKTEALLSKATEDYEYLNNMLKREIPRFFHLKAQFIGPVLEHFYHMQIRIYGLLYARCHELVNANTGYFVSHAMPVQEGFAWRKAQRNVQAELENMDLLKAGGKAWLKVSGGANNSNLTLRERAALRQTESTEYGAEPGGVGPAKGAVGSVGGAPPYSPTTAYPSPQSMHSQPLHGQFAASPVPMPASVAPPKPSAPQSPKATYVIALYDYEAQAEGDLSFRKDDKIELISRTEDQNDWWTGRIGGGPPGIFPGNYVALI